MRQAPLGREGAHIHHTPFSYKHDRATMRHPRARQLPLNQAALDCGCNPRCVDFFCGGVWQESVHLSKLTKPRSHTRVPLPLPTPVCFPLLGSECASLLRYHFCMRTVCALGPHRSARTEFPVAKSPCHHLLCVLSFSLEKRMRQRQIHAIRTRLLRSHAPPWSTPRPPPLSSTQRSR
jgi:hypothetical protein